MSFPINLIQKLIINLPLEPLIGGGPNSTHHIPLSNRFTPLDSTKSITGKVKGVQEKDLSSANPAVGIHQMEVGVKALDNKGKNKGCCNGFDDKLVNGVGYHDGKTMIQTSASLALRERGKSSDPYHLSEGFDVVGRGWSVDDELTVDAGDDGEAFESLVQSSGSILGAPPWNCVRGADEKCLMSVRGAGMEGKTIVIDIDVDVTPCHEEGIVFTTPESRQSAMDLEERWRNNVLKSPIDSDKEYMSQEGFQEEEGLVSLL